MVTYLNVDRYAFESSSEPGFDSTEFGLTASTAYCVGWQRLWTRRSWNCCCCCRMRLATEKNVRLPEFPLIFSWMAVTYSLVLSLYRGRLKITLTSITSSSLWFKSPSLPFWVRSLWERGCVTYFREKISEIGSTFLKYPVLYSCITEGLLKSLAMINTFAGVQNSFLLKLGIMENCDSLKLSQIKCYNVKYSPSGNFSNPHFPTSSGIWFPCVWKDEIDVMFI